ncbi:hypothetical protein AB0C96_02110 [Streptomyces sp. NPDC048506]|uniref:hypothetical protein n=1 Tax=Streptomyces sp. NPDC048506 TaxID=3155028 RepID=UPI00342E69E1
MHKLRKAAVVVAVLGTVSFLGAGTASAAGRGGGGWCRSHDLNVDVLGQVGVLNGLLGNALNGEGAPGANIGGVGSSMGCNGGW